MHAAPAAHAGHRRPLHPHLENASSVGLFVAIAHIDCGGHRCPWGSAHGHLVADPIALPNDLWVGGQRATSGLGQPRDTKAQGQKKGAPAKISLLSELLKGCFLEAGA